MAIAVVYIALWRLFWVNWRYRCQVRKRSFSGFETDFTALAVLFLAILELILCRSEVPLPRNERKRWFVSFETGFSAFTVLFLELWMLFWVNWRYCWRYMGENVQSPCLKPVLMCSLLNFSKIRGYFESIGDTVAKIRAKTYILHL